jgi:hypothetical protein
MLVKACSPIYETFFGMSIDLKPHKMNSTTISLVTAESEEKIRKFFNLYKEVLLHFLHLYAKYILTSSNYTNIYAKT